MDFIFFLGFARTTLRSPSRGQHSFQFPVDPVFHKILPALATAKIIAFHTPSVLCPWIQKLQAIFLSTTKNTSLISRQMAFVAVHRLPLFWQRKRDPLVQLKAKYAALGFFAGSRLDLLADRTTHIILMQECLILLFSLNLTLPKAYFNYLGNYLSSVQPSCPLILGPSGNSLDGPKFMVVLSPLGRILSSLSSARPQCCSCIPPVFPPRP